MKKVLLIVLTVLLAGWLGLAMRRARGIPSMGRNIALIEGEMIVINWDASLEDAQDAIARWQELKK